MLPDTIWVGPFWTIAIIRPGGSGWITALTTPPIFGSCAKAAGATQTRAKPTKTRFNIFFLSDSSRVTAHYCVALPARACKNGAARPSRGARADADCEAVRILI